MDDNVFYDKWGAAAHATAMGAHQMHANGLAHGFAGDADVFGGFPGPEDHAHHHHPAHHPHHPAHHPHHPAHHPAHQPHHPHHLGPPVHYRHPAAMPPMKAEPPRAQEKQRKPKRKKDPNAPKKPLTAYFIWMKEERPKLMKEDPTLKMKDISERLGKIWKTMDDEAKQEWQAKADQDKIRYQTQMETYVPPQHFDDDDGPRKKNRKRREKDPNAPKKPLTAYFHFMSEQRSNCLAENPKAPHKTISVLLGAQWKMMTDEQKEPYAARARADRQRYDTEMTAYRASQQQQLPSMESSAL